MTIKILKPCLSKHNIKPIKLNMIYSDIQRLIHLQNRTEYFIKEKVNILITV